MLLKDPNYRKPMKGLDFEPESKIDNSGKKVKATNLPEEVAYMPKLNGVRIRWDVIHQCFRTNSGAMVKSCDHLVEQVRDTKHMKHMPVDGESYNHDGGISFQEINGLTRRQYSSSESEVLQFHIFDIAIYDDKRFPKVARLRMIEKLFEVESMGSGLVRVPFEIGPAASVDQVFRQHLAQRYEGIMISDPASTYTEGKGKWMWKYKPVHSHEFSFVGFEYATEGRNVGMFAALRLKMDNGHEFRCSGISDEMKIKLLENQPPIGAPMTVEFGDLSKDGVPIFPRFVDVRWDQ